MSLQECTTALQTQGSLRINAGEFSIADLEEAARAARESHSLLFLYNLKGRSGADIARLNLAGGRQLILDDLRLI